MPIYEYQCTECGQNTEIFQRMSDDPLTACEKCSGKIKKLISQNTFHLKGSGWYVTDYANKNNSNSNSSNGAAPDKDTKPAVEAKSDNSEAKKSASTGSKDTKTKS